MAPLIQRKLPVPVRDVASRGRLLERLAAGLAHEGKNPLNNMVLHLQLISEQGGPVVAKHLAAVRESIGKVDDLLRAFAEFAAPDHLGPDLPAAALRSLQLFAFDARRAGVEVSYEGPATLLVSAESRSLCDAVAHALVSCIELVRDGGHVRLTVQARAAADVLELVAGGGNARLEEAEPHLAALRRLASEEGFELSVDTPPAGGARLSLSFLHPR